MDVCTRVRVWVLWLIVGFSLSRLRIPPCISALFDSHFDKNVLFVCRYSAFVAVRWLCRPHAIAPRRDDARDWHVSGAE